MKIELACAACGNNRFSFAEALHDDAPVRCDDCGHQVGTLGSLKEEVARIVLDRSAQSRNELPNPSPQGG